MTQQNHPHILLITTDEQHKDTVFSPVRPYKLPALDELLKNSVNYATTYSASPVCLPSRCTWMTGQYPFHNRCCSNGTGRCLPLEIPNLFTCLKKAGYHTSLHGKCHFIPVPYAAVRKDITQDYRHFTAYYQQLGMDHLDLQDDKNVSLWFYDHYSRELEEKGMLSRYADTFLSSTEAFSLPDFPLPEEEHPDSWVGRKALEWIREQDPTVPQFTWVSFSGPHYPMDAPDAWCRQVDMDRDMPRIRQDGEWDDPGKIMKYSFWGPGATEGSGSAPGGAQRTFTEEYWRKWRQKYYGNIVQIDYYIGQIVNLAREKYGDNLMILFTSDHGDMMGNHDLWGKNTSLNEDVLRVPMIVHYPGQRKPICRTETVSSVDLFATVLAQAGCELPADCDGRPFEEIAAAGGRRRIVSCCQNRVAVIENGYKLCRNLYERTGELFLELYDLRQDPNEFHNLWRDPEYGKVRGDMLGVLQEMERNSGLITTLFENHGRNKPFWY